jgi:hypothetical protein
MNHPAIVKTDESDHEELLAYSEDGVDVTLIRWMLSLTPRERLAVHSRSPENLNKVLEALRLCNAWRFSSRGGPHQFGHIETFPSNNQLYWLSLRPRTDVPKYLGKSATTELGINTLQSQALRKGARAGLADFDPAQRGSGTGKGQSGVACTSTGLGRNAKRRVT